MEYAVVGYILIWSSLGWFAWNTRRRLVEAESLLESEEYQ